MKEPSTTLEKAKLTTYKGYGLPLALKTYTKLCKNDYPSDIKGYALAPSKWDAATNTVTTDPATGSLVLKSYCDGGAQALAVAAAATAAITVSLY